jgi:hypothetical protein
LIQALNPQVKNHLKALSRLFVNTLYVIPVTQPLGSGRFVVWVKQGNQKIDIRKPAPSHWLYTLAVFLLLDAKN